MYTASNSAAERSFSTLSRVTNYLRSTVGQKMFVNLAVLAIGKDLRCKLDFNNVIDTFANVKARRKHSENFSLNFLKSFTIN